MSDRRNGGVGVERDVEWSRVGVRWEVKHWFDGELRRGEDVSGSGERRREY